MQELSDTTIVRGDTVEMVLTFTEQDAVPPEFSLSNYTNVLADFRERASEASQLIVSKSLGAGITVSANTLLIELSSTETNLFDEGNYHFDIRFLIGTAVDTYLSGKLIVKQNTTAL